MAKRNQALQPIPDETIELKSRLEETEETLRAIRQYIVDAFVVTRPSGTQVVTMNDADFLYRRMVESMNEGAVTVIPDGTIFYCNPRFAEMIQIEPEKLIGTAFQDLILTKEQDAFEAIFRGTDPHGARGEFCLRTARGECLPVQLSIHMLDGTDSMGTSIIATDLTERFQSEKKIRALASKLTRAEQEERQRISGILHDDLQQRLFAMKALMSLVTDTSEIKTLPQATQADLDYIQESLSAAIRITRSLSIDLSPVLIQGEGLRQAILWLSAQMKELHGLEVKIEGQEDFQHLDDHMRVLLFHAVREFLFNIVKHSGISQGTVTLEQVNQRGFVTISDTGKGFDVEAVVHDPKIVHSLLTVQDRLRLMGCDMEITSSPGKGTRIAIGLPLAGPPS